LRRDSQAKAQQKAKQQAATTALSAHASVMSVNLRQAAPVLSREERSNLWHLLTA
jgi:hypothetical protein